MRVVDVDKNHYDAALELISSSFADDVLLKYYTMRSGKKHEKVAKKIMQVELDSHFDSDQIIRGIVDDSGLIGVVLVKKPRKGFGYRLHLKMLWQVIVRTSPLVALRVLIAGAKSKLNTNGRDYHYLSAIAVKKGVRGKGVGRTLLDNVHRLVDEHKTSRGIGLRTTTMKNRKIFERFGYGVVEYQKVFNFGKFYMFRPKSDMFINA